MTPFYDKGKFVSLSRPASTSPRFIPDKNGYGVEIRNGRDIFKRSNLFFASSGKWLEMNDDGLIDPEISPAVIGQSIDLLDYVPYEDQNERKTAPEVLTSGQIIAGSTIDFESMTSKDGRITVFNISARGYVFREEVPFSIRGIKVSNDTITGYSSGKSRNHFLDGGGTGLGVAATGFYGQSPEVSHVFQDKVDVNGLGIQIDTEDYDSEYQTGAFGTSLYSSEFGTDSIAYAGLKK